MYWFVIINRCIRIRCTLCFLLFYSLTVAWIIDRRVNSIRSFVPFSLATQRFLVCSGNKLSNIFARRRRGYMLSSIHFRCDGNLGAFDFNENKHLIPPLLSSSEVFIRNLFSDSPGVRFARFIVTFRIDAVI